MADRSARDEERAGQVDAEDVLELVRVGVEQRPRAADAGVEHDGVEALERRHGVGDGALGVGGDCGVGHDREPSDLGGDGFDGLAPAARDGDAVAVRGEPPCHGRADPRAAARDERGAAHSSRTVSRSSTV